ncbi:MAG: RDD family protein [Elusimicrobia bacterium]|nr:RDD family protein [Elusimicrobiota bacterium]
MNTPEQSAETNPSTTVDKQQPAGFWIRCGAFTLDSLLTLLGSVIIGFLLTGSYWFEYPSLLSIVTVFVLFIIIHIFSPGKFIAGIAVVRIDGSLLTYFRRIARGMGPGMLISLLAMQFSSMGHHAFPEVFVSFGVLIMGILVAIAALPRKRAMHDYLTGTCVVYIKNISLWRKAVVVCMGVSILVFTAISTQTILLEWVNTLYDDKLEPNNTPETATPLTLGKSVDGRVISGNPDYFSVEAKSGQTIVFQLINLGGTKDWARFKVLDSHTKILYEDNIRPLTYNEREHPSPEIYPDVKLSENLGYELSVSIKLQGVYYLVIDESKFHDKPIFWKYRLTANIDSKE